jgi:hypothetical protein
VQEQTAGAGGRSSRRQEVEEQAKAEMSFADQNLTNFEKEMKSYATSQGFRGLKVYRLAFRLAMEIFHESKHFQREEKLLIDGSNSQSVAKRTFKHWRGLS